MKKLLAIVVLGLLLVGCAATQTTQTKRERIIGADEHYTLCADQHNDIRQIVSCGKNSRIAYINRTGETASDFGNQYVIFMDALSEAVDEGSLTNAQAKLKWMNANQQLKNQQTRTQTQTVIVEQQKTYPKVACEAMGGLVC